MAARGSGWLGGSAPTTREVHRAPVASFLFLWLIDLMGIIRLAKFCPGIVNFPDQAHILLSLHSLVLKSPS